ncbi:unnamed protein product [Rotaria magnacalcarata]|uniref:Uncharacterized protein n=3 Tax=Rotaria magnacalcarata TaxID=392030 RepID=A0A816UXV2_9BILA|nr:unnamed protein product [Rotaria magnacalcarata]
MFVEIYRRLSPVIRATIDIALSQQPFPHFFHRRMKSFKDLSFIKATEILNILFYGFLPIFHQHLQHDYLGHFALYICAMRLFHGRAILGPRTSDIANDLIMKYYHDFNSFYDGLENFVLHLHSHYQSQYRMYGTFSHLGSFGQESLIGYIGSNRKGTTHQGDIICENYGIDLMLHHQIENICSCTNIADGPFDPDLNFDFRSNDSVINFHNTECTCRSIKCCLRAFRRYAVKQRVYHSLTYNRRQKSVSYFVRYYSKDNSTSYFFGKIVMFFKYSNSNCTYALIERYPVQDERSNSNSKKIYTPTTNAPEPECFLCRIIDSGEYVIVQRSSMKRIYDDSAEIMVYGQRTEARIEHRGTREECRRVWGNKEEIHKLKGRDPQYDSDIEEDVDLNEYDEEPTEILTCYSSRDPQYDSDIEEDVDLNEYDEEPTEILTCYSTSKTSTKTFAPQRKRTLVESSITINSRSSISPKKTKHNDFEKEIQVLPNDILNDEENNKRCLTASSTSSIIQHIDALFSSVRRENEKQFKELSKQIDRKHNIDSIDLSAFREPGNDQARDDVIHDNVNLLRIRGKNVGDYGRQVLRCLYSREELLVSILPPGGTQYSRKPLDIVRFEKFHDAMRGKYRIADHYYDEFYNKLVRPKLVDFLSDERKRERQKQSTNSLSSQSSSPDHNLSF